MPTIQFKGKRAVWSYHLSIPFHTLDEKPSLSFQPEKAENLIIEGDNLLALKALAPQYTGKIKCIYIDPPYNTGNENWVYNDNVNNPLFKTWLGKTVGKDDLTRHDKWLCMMTPRLQLMRDLLSDDGAIFVSIDYNEEAFLRCLLNEIFGEENYRNTFIVSRVKKNIKEHEKVNAINFGYNSIILYAKTDKTLFIPPTIFDEKAERWHAFDAPGVRPTMEYELFGNKPPHNRHWMFSPEKAQELITKGLLIANEKTGKPKYRLEASNETLLDTDWTDLQEAGFFFDFPNGEKNIKLIKRIVGMLCVKDDIILDAFAGSGTTLHAVIDLNSGDGGKRSCILIQATESSEAEPQKNICENITRERNKRAIEKYNYNSGFAYLKVGIAIDAETMLSGQLPPYRQFAEYVYYLCTGKHLADKSSINEETYFVAEYENAVIYLIYKKDFETLSKMALNITIVKDMITQHPNKKYIVYAPSCWLEEDFMKDNRIDFVGIPYNLFERVETQ